METLFFLVIAVLLAYAVGCWGRTRKIGFGLAPDFGGFNISSNSNLSKYP